MSVFEWEEFRREKDDYFGTSRHSLLSAEQKATFQGLRYFPVSEQWVFDVPLERYAFPKKVFLATNSPIPPVENWLKIRVEAGEMKFHE